MGDSATKDSLPNVNECEHTSKSYIEKILQCYHKYECSLQCCHTFFINLDTSSTTLTVHFEYRNNETILTMDESDISGSLGIILTLAVTISHSMSIEHIMTMADEDDKFVTVYGNDFETSGIWHQLRDICKNDTAYMTRIESICGQAHKKAGKIEGDVDLALCFTRKLIFRDSVKYKPIKLDIVCYIISGLARADGSPYYFYITKGLGPNCVYYLHSFTNDTSRLRLDEHVCGIVL